MMDSSSLEVVPNSDVRLMEEEYVSKLYSSLFSILCFPRGNSIIIFGLANLQHSCTTSG